MDSPRKPVLLGVSYDKGRLLARMDVLQATGMEGMPASSKSAAFSAITQTFIDLLVIAVDVPDEDKVEITDIFRKKQRGKVIWTSAGKVESPIQPDAYVPPDQPVLLAKTIMKLLGVKPPRKS